MKTILQERAEKACAASLAARERFIASGSHLDCVRYAVAMAQADNAIIAAMKEARHG